MAQDAPSPPAPGYRLEELGWLQFERLCGLVLEAESGLEIPLWSGHADTARIALLEEPLALPGHGVKLPGPLAVAIVWVRAGLDEAHGLAHVAAAVSEIPAAVGYWPDDVLVLTNVESRLARRELLLRFGAPDLTVQQRLLRRGGFVVLGGGELGLVLDRDPRLRAALPSVLGLRDLTALISPGARERSTFDIEGAQALARVFWPTRAYQRTRDVLERHRFAVLTGPPEMGKTAIARMLALALLTDGWEAHETSDPDELWRAYDRGRNQVFVADDAFGSTEYRPDAAERWARELGRLLGGLDDRHRLIWTSRPAPLKAAIRRVQRERGAERFPAPAQIQVDAGDLDLAEKTLILFRHAKARAVGPAACRLVRAAAVDIVEHPHFTPERVRRLVDGRLERLAAMTSGRPGVVGRPFLRQIDRELAEPTDAMRTSFRALDAQYRELLMALLDGPAGLIDERELTALARRHYAGGLSRPPGELIDRLSDHFLRVSPLGIGWVHPSWRDLVIGELRADRSARRRFLGACGLHGAILALSREGGRAGERTLPLLVDDADWDTLADRLDELLRELEDQELARLLAALREARAGEVEPRVAAELDGLARGVLTASRRAWDRQHRVLPVFLLEAWYGLRAFLEDPPEPPALGLTWCELLPRVGAVTGRWLGTDLVGVDEWLALAQLLGQFDPGALEELGFFAAGRARLREVAASLGRGPDPDSAALVESILARIRALAPDCADAADVAARAMGSATAEAERWWVPHDLAAPPTLDPVAVRPSEFTRADVRRVLDDL